MNTLEQRETDYNNDNNMQMNLKVHKVWNSNLGLVSRDKLIPLTDW